MRWFGAYVGFVAVLGAIPVGARAASGSCGNLESPQAIADALNSKDSVARVRAESCGLASDDRATRGLVIRHYLAGSPTLTISIENLDGDKEAADYLKFMPAFYANNLEWSADGGKFKGNNAVGGSIVGDSLTISFPTAVVLNEEGKGTDRACNASLRLNEKRDALDGTLRCQGVPYRFHAWFGF